MKANKYKLFARYKVIVCIMYTLTLLSLISYAEKLDAQTVMPVAQGSSFSVESFRQLPTDVSAFIDVVRDLNGEACALVKVVAPSDFAFSSPLGIVKRSDEVGEIWLYMPKGTKTLTLKHPQWGVLRNYPLNVKLESRMTYEMRLRLPKAPVVERHDTIVRTQTIIDTITVVQPKRIVPLHGYALLTASLHTDGPSWGILLAAMRCHGAYVHVSTNLRAAVKASGECDADGYRVDNGCKPYYTGRTQTAEYAVTLGGIHRLGSALNIFEGIGYGSQTTSWQLAESEGGGWLRNTHLTYKGVSAELGVMASLYDRLTVSVSALTIAGKSWQVGIGVGIRLGSSNVMEK